MPTVRGSCSRHAEFLPSLADGSTNHKTSNVLDHTKSQEHTTSMVRFQEERTKSQDVPASSYAPAVCSLMVLDSCEKARMKHKLEKAVSLSQKSSHLMTGTDCLLNSQPHGYI